MITVAPGKHRMPRRQGMARAALSAASQRPALTDPDWPPGEAGSWPQWDGPPSLHPDHPSAPNQNELRLPAASDDNCAIDPYLSFCPDTGKGDDHS